MLSMKRRPSILHIKNMTCTPCDVLVVILLSIPYKLIVSPLQTMRCSSDRSYDRAGSFRGYGCGCSRLFRQAESSTSQAKG